MASSTTYLSFTSEGGRNGHIAWSNGDEDSWGRFRWDRWWPRNPPTPAEAAEVAAFLAKTMKAMGASIRQATEAARVLGAAMANDRQPNMEEATDQPAPSDLWPGDDVMSPPTPYVFNVSLKEVKKPFPRPQAR